MKIYFIMNVRFPTEKAHGWQIAKMCEAFLLLGHEVVLVVPDRKNVITKSAKEYYHLTIDIPIVRLPVIDMLSSRWGRSRLSFVIMEWTFIRALRLWLKRRSSESAVLFTRDQFFAERFAKTSWHIALEVHDISQGFFKKHPRLAKNVDLFVMTNSWKKHEAVRVWGETVKEKIIALPNAIDIKAYQDMDSVSEARQKLGWDQERYYAVYTGHFYNWKGAYVLADASQQLDDRYCIVLLGGIKEDFAKMKAYVATHALKHILLIPYVPQDQVRTYLAAANCLVLPNSGKSWHSRFTTSPIKLWEYLAAKRPVVASDLPAIRELVTEREVYFVPPDNTKALAKAIQLLAQGDSKRVNAGFVLAAANDWETRAKRLIEAFQMI